MRRAAAVAAVGLTVVAVLAVAAIGQAGGQPPRLDAVVGTNDGFDITVNDTNGREVSAIPPGTYTFVVHDRSQLHNFHLASNQDATVDFRTDVEFVGDRTFTVTFNPRVRYVFACEPHFQTMFGSFVTEPGGSTPPPAPPPPAPPPMRLAASVSATGVTTLTPRIVRRGRVRITVRDRSTKHNFRLTGPGLDRRTGLRFTGTATWTATLRPGIYRFGTDPRRRVGTLRVS